MHCAHTYIQNFAYTFIAALAKLFPCDPFTLLILHACMKQVIPMVYIRVFQEMISPMCRVLWRLCLLRRKLSPAVLPLVPNLGGQSPIHPALLSQQQQQLQHPLVQMKYKQQLQHQQVPVANQHQRTRQQHLLLKQKVSISLLLHCQIGHSLLHIGFRHLLALTNFCPGCGITL